MPSFFTSNVSKHLLIVSAVLAMVHSRNLTELSWEYNRNSAILPGMQRFIVVRSVITTTEGDWFACNEFCSAELCGTYVNAPYHKYKYGWKMHDVPIENLILPGMLIDVSSNVSRYGPDTKLEKDDLVSWYRYNSPLPDKMILLVRFGWSQFYYHEKMYYGWRDKAMHFPGISVDASRWIVDTGKIVGVGVDVSRLDPGKVEEKSAHRILSENQIYGIANLNISWNMPIKDFTLLVMPLKFTDGTGSPARVVAIIGRQKYDIFQTVHLKEYDMLIKFYGELMFAICCFVLFLLLLVHALYEISDML